MQGLGLTEAACIRQTYAPMFSKLASIRARICTRWSGRAHTCATCTQWAQSQGHLSPTSDGTLSHTSHLPMALKSCCAQPFLLYLHVIHSPRNPPAELRVCAAGFFKVGNDACKACLATCKSCASETNCTTCATGYLSYRGACCEHEPRRSKNPIIPPGRGSPILMS